MHILSQEQYRRVAQDKKRMGECNMKIRIKKNELTSRELKRKFMMDEL